MNNAVSTMEQHLHNIVDENHPLFTPISDEQIVENFEDHGVFTRDFLHETGKKCE